MIIFTLWNTSNKNSQTRNTLEWDKHTILYNELENNSYIATASSLHHFQIYVRPFDLISNSIKSGGNWQDCLELVRLWDRLPGREENDFFLDIGANIGICSMNFLDRGIRTISIEPIPGNLNLYTKSLLINKQMLKNVTLFPYGVGECEKDSEIKIRRGNYGGSSILEDSQNYLKFPIKIYTLNHLLSNLNSKIHLACLDVEGYEYYTLLGSIDLLKRKIVRHFYMELLCKNLLLINKKEDDIYNIFEQNGYHLSKKYCKKPSDAFNILVSEN